MQYNVLLEVSRFSTMCKVYITKSMWNYQGTADLTTVYFLLTHIDITLFLLFLHNHTLETKIIQFNQYPITCVRYRTQQSLDEAYWWCRIKQLLPCDEYVHLGNILNSLQIFTGIENTFLIHTTSETWITNSSNLFEIWDLFCNKLAGIDKHHACLFWTSKIELK